MLFLNVIVPSSFTVNSYIVSFNKYPVGAVISLYLYVFPLCKFSNVTLPSIPVVPCIGFPLPFVIAFPVSSYIPITAPDNTSSVILSFFIIPTEYFIGSLYITPYNFPFISI